MIPTPDVRKVAPVCSYCGRTRFLIRDDGPIRCRRCVWQAGNESKRAPRKRR